MRAPLLTVVACRDVQPRQITREVLPLDRIRERLELLSACLFHDSWLRTLGDDVPASALQSMQTASRHSLNVGVTQQRSDRIRRIGQVNQAHKAVVLEKAPATDHEY